MFVLAMLAVLGETLVHGAASLARVALHQRALDAARLAFVSGTRAAQSALARGETPTPTATCAYADAAGCEIAVQTTFALPAAAATPGTCPGTPCVVELQSNSAVDEGRAAYVISTTVMAANGAPLASRSGVVAFRTFATAPYAAIVGGADGTLGENAPGDDAGSANTLITVEYDLRGGASATAGNVWQPLVESPASAAPAWDR